MPPGDPPPGAGAILPEMLSKGGGCRRQWEKGFVEWGLQSSAPNGNLGSKDAHVHWRAVGRDRAPV